MAFEFKVRVKHYLTSPRNASKQNSRIPLMIIVTRQGNDADFCVHNGSAVSRGRIRRELNLYIEIFRTMIADRSEKNEDSYNNHLPFDHSENNRDLQI